MSYIVSVTTSTKNGASVAPDEGAHAIGDLLCVFASNDNGGTELDTSSTGWSKLGTTAASAGVRSAWFWKIATGTTGETPTITGAADDWAFSFYVIRNAHATQPFGATPTDGTDFKRTDYDLSSVKGSINIAASALTTGAANALLLIGICIDTGAATLGIKPNPDDFVQDGAIVINSGGVSHITGHLQFGAAAATPALTAYSNVQEGGNAWLIAVRDDGTGDYLQKDCRTGGEVIKWHGDFGNTFETLSYTSPVTLFDTTTNKIDGLDASAIAPTVSTLADALAAPGGLSSFANATNGGSDVWAGMSYAITSTNMTGQVVSCRWQLSSTSAPLGTKGLILLFGSGSDMETNWVAYQLIANPATTAGISASNNYMSAVALGAATVFASHGTIDWTDVTRRGFCYHRLAGSATSRTIYLRNEIRHAAAKLIGGNSASPAQVSFIPDSTRNNGVPYVNTKQGTGQALTKGAIQIGDGATPTYFKLESQSFEFPQSWLISDIDRLEWNADAGSVGVTVYAADGDTMDFSAGTIASATKQPFTIHASSSTDGTTSYNFSGMGLVGYDPTWKTGVACNGVTFANCDTVKLKGASATGITVKSLHDDVGASDAAVSWDASGATLTSSTIDVTGSSAGYHIELGTSVTGITLTDVTFTGTPGTDKVHVLATTGTVTITISGTTTLASGDVTTEGAMVVIAAPQPTLDATVLASSRVVLYNNTTAAELDNTAPGGISWSKIITSGASNGDSLTLHVFKEGYQEFSTTFLYTGEDTTILVTQETDPNITSLRTELGITDYTTITEFALDVTGNVEIDADDADGSTTKARLAIWYNGVLTTENGARYLRGAITILSTAAFRINTSIIDLKIENISATYGLNFTDTERRLYRDDGAPIYAAVSAPGSIQNDYSGVPDTVETGVSGLTGSESAQLMALPNATSIAAAVWAYVITGSTTAVQMMRGFAAVLLGKVSGVGTGTETFRDIADTTDVVVATVDSDGNRTAITRDLT